jgi:hypothetical protein
MKEADTNRLLTSRRTSISKQTKNAGRPEFCGICCLEDDENVHSEDDLEEVIREVITVTDISTTPMSMNKGLKRSDVKIIVGLHYGATYSSMFPPLLKKIMVA